MLDARCWTLPSNQQPATIFLLRSLCVRKDCCGKIKDVIQALRKTKILATLGPTSDSPEMIQQLIEAGVNGFRLNFSHKGYGYFQPLIGLIRTISKRLEMPVAILQDLQGPKIRVGSLKDGKPVRLIPGAKLVLTTREVEGNDMQVPTTYAGLPGDVRPGNKILLDDGNLELQVVKVSGTDVETEVIVGGDLKEHKGINLPGIVVSAPSMTEKDLKDARFGAEMGVDYIALSFVRTASDVSRLRALLNEVRHSEIKIIAKIEKPEAVKNLSEILDVSDGVMVARGDLGVEVSAEKVPMLQKMIIEKANKAEKLVITATQMLESMVTSARPTRAEASDVANAILDGTDVVMLSQETAVGAHPVKAVKTMSAIAEYTESDYEVFQYTQHLRSQKVVTFTHAMVHAARSAAEVLKAKAILVLTQSGSTAQLASSQRPECPIFGFSPLEKAYHQMALVWGVSPVFSDFIPNVETMMKRAEDLLLEAKVVQKGDVVVIVAGTNPTRGATNMMKIERIGEQSGP